MLKKTLLNILQALSISQQMNVLFYSRIQILVLLVMSVSAHAVKANAEICIRVSEQSSLREVPINQAHEPFTKVLLPNVCNSFDLSVPVEVISDDRIPTLLVPVTGSANVAINAPLKSEFLKKMEGEELDSLLSTVMGDLSDIQSDIRKQQLDQALHSLQSLEAKYPNVKFLEFTRASILLLQGKREEAKRVAEAAQKAVPNYQEGNRFLNSLGKRNPEEKK